MREKFPRRPLLDHMLRSSVISNTSHCVKNSNYPEAYLQGGMGVPIPNCCGVRVFATFMREIFSCTPVILGVYAVSFSEAYAQLPVPPKEVFSDVNGVSARTGNPNFEFRELGIGPENDLGLHLTRYLSDGVFRDSFDSTYYEVRTSNNWSTSVSFGNIGDTFGAVGFEVAAFVNPASPPIYQHRSGATVTFGQLIFQQYDEGISYNYWLATSVRYPTGSNVKLYYKVINGTLPLFRIQSVTNNAGYQIKFKYASDNPSNGDWGRRISATAINMAVDYCDPNADNCTFSQAWPTASYSRWMEGSTNAFSVVNAVGETTTFRTTPGSPSRFSIALPGSAAEARVYTLYGKDVTGMGDSSRVTQFQSPVKTTNYTYNWTSCVGASPGSNCGYLDQIVAVEPDGASVTYKSNGPGVLGMKYITDPLGRTQTFEYDRKGLITKATWPEGNRTEWTRDANENAVEERAYSKDGASVLTTTQTFGACNMGVMTCTLPLTVTDARGNTTTNIYNGHGQKTAEIGPPNSNGTRSVTRWIYTDRYAYVKSLAGVLVQAETPVSVLSQIITCVNSFNGSMTAPACGSGSDEVVTSYEFSVAPGPNALLPIGRTISSGGTSFRACFAYDALGNKIAETTPRANSLGCS